MGLGAGMAVLHDGAEGQEAAPGPRALCSRGREHWRRGTLPSTHNDTSVFLLFTELSPNEISAR